jgi:hypothetical protein
MSRSDNVLSECREMLARGAKLEEIVMVLRQNGFSKVQSIKELIDLKQADAYSGKEIVHNSPTWADVRERDEEFQRGLESLANQQTE